MEYCRMYQNDGKIKGVAVELSLAECRVVMDALKGEINRMCVTKELSEHDIMYCSGAQDMLDGLKKACGGADEQEE